MKRLTKSMSILLFLALTLLFTLSTTLAQSEDADYDLSWWTVDGGGGNMTGGDYTLDSTAGQSDAALWQGEGYILTGGFWNGGMAEYRIYLPLVLREP